MSLFRVVVLFDFNNLTIVLLRFLQMMCRELWCHSSRYMRNKTCLPGNFIGPTNSLFGIFIKFTPVPDGTITSLTEDMMNVSIIQSNLQKIMTGLIPEAGIKDFRIYRTTIRTNNDVIIENFLVRVIVDAATFVDANDTLQRTIVNVHNISFSLLPNISFLAHFVHCSFNSFSDFVCNIYPPIEMISIQTYLGEVAIIKQIRQFTENTHIPIDIPTPETITKLYICPFVEISIHEFPLNIENNILYFTGNRSHFVFTKWEFEQSDDIIILCIDDFEAVYDIFSDSDYLNRPNTVTGELRVLPKEILSLVCTCLSIACLLITIVVYITFSELQSQPGVNTIMLCISLFLAQTVYQFGSGQSSLPAWLCELIGAICHFLWLSVMFSLNVCSVEIYLAFTKLKPIARKFKWKPIIRNILYVVSSSLTLVIINIIVSISTSNGKNTGYGGSVCYLSSKLLHMTTFLIPTAVTIFINIFLFCLVVINIKTSDIKSFNVNKHRNYLGIYARLSTLTGIAWIFGFIRIFWHIDVFEYLFIILNASHGICIMIAFVSTKKVWSRFCWCNEPPDKDLQNE